LEKTAAAKSSSYHLASRKDFMSGRSPTPYPEVNSILNVLLAEAQAILVEQFIGLYLYGSLACGGFDRHSDVDFVVVTQAELPDARFTALQEIHAHLSTLDSWCATQLEGSYIPRAALRRYDPVHALHVHIDRGNGETLKRMNIHHENLRRAWWGGWVVLRSNLWEHGITVAGAAPHTLIDPVTPKDLRQATLALLQGWAANILEDPSQMDTRGYQSYVVLTLCRILYTLQHGTLVSKPIAVDWARETLGEQWLPLIDRAWAGRQNPQSEIPPDDINGTLAFIHSTIEHSQ
jgi:predicted nucleotidyltransferase